MAVTDTRTMVADTHGVVADTHTMVADIHRSVLTGQEGASGRNRSVRATYYPYLNNAYHHLDTSQVGDAEYNCIRSLTFL